MMRAAFLLGADPELFMKSPNNGGFVSAHGRIPGTKHEPHKVPYGAVQIDGTALEFNIDPAATCDEFVHNIQAVRKTITDMVPGYNVVAEPTAIYDKDYFDWEVPATAKELGCDPDYNAWTMSVNPRPEPGDRPMRTAAGHIHIGWTEDADLFNHQHFARCGAVARQMDYFLGIHSLLWDPDATRRELYGKAGAFRPKSYGMEYRVMSNRWLSDEKLMRWVFNSARAGMYWFNKGKIAEEVYGETAKLIIDNNVTEWPDLHHIDLPLEDLPKVS